MASFEEIRHRVEQRLEELFESRPGFAPRSKRSAATVLQPAAVCPSSRPSAAIGSSSQDAVRRSRPWNPRV